MRCLCWNENSLDVFACNMNHDDTFRVCVEFTRSKREHFEHENDRTFDTFKRQKIVFEAINQAGRVISYH